MSIFAFEDNELDMLFAFINKAQLCFHPVFAREGHFSSHDFFELGSHEKNIFIIADNNIISPICEISKKGKLKDTSRLRKIAAFVTWSKLIGAQITCGIGLLENDTAHISTTMGEENRQLFLHGLNYIPSQIWKDIAFGARDNVPNSFLYTGIIQEDKYYELTDNLLFLCNEVSIVKIVQLLLQPKPEPIDNFIDFMNWYADNLDIAESVVVYAALVFANIPHTALPKGVFSKKYEKIVKGIKNQAWDITYITFWSQQYYHETDIEHWMFATDDITQKQIVVNVLPPGECTKALYAIFTTKTQREKLDKLQCSKLGKARIRPFQGMTDNAKMAIVKKLLAFSYATLESIVKEAKE